ncbi:MAG: sigma-70 family RNA polymerase sigma factor [Caldisericaceae bacterium]
MNKDISDLIEQAKQGDKAAQEKVIISYLPLVKKVVRYYGISLGREDKEDLFIEGLLGLIRSVAIYDSSKGDFENLAFITIRNAIFDYFKNKRPVNPLDESYEDKFDIEDYVTVKESIKEFEGFLSPLEKSVFELYLEGRKMSEIANMLNRSYKSCDNAMQRIKKRAADFFK